MLAVKVNLNSKLKEHVFLTRSIWILQTERLNAIQELQQALQDQKMVQMYIIPNLDDVMAMITTNIFRPLPCVKKSNLGFAETGLDQEEEMDPAWPHL